MNLGENKKLGLYVIRIIDQDMVFKVISVFQNQTQADPLENNFKRLFLCAVNTLL